MDNQEWLEARRTGIGGSDIAAVLGLSPWRSPLDVWKDKVGQAEPQEINEKMEWGILLEDLVARKWARTFGKLVRRVNQVLRHPLLPMVANIDRAIHEAGTMPVVNGQFRTKEFLECKTASEYSKHLWGEEGTDEIPEYYITQCLHYLGITGCDVCHVAVLIGGSDFRAYKVLRDDEAIGIMWDAAAKWWRDYVVTRNPPPPRTIEEAQALFPRHKDAKSITVSEHTKGLILSLRAMQEVRKDAENKEKELKDLIASEMRDAEALVDASGRPLLTWKASKDSEKTSWEKAAQELAQKLGEEGERIIKANTYTMAGSRRMLIKIKEGAEQNG